MIVCYVLTFLAGPTAFTVYGEDSTYEFEGQSLQFPNVITNTGDHFDVGSGVFICPTSGLYLFYSALTSPAQAYCSADVIQDFNYFVTTIQAYQNPAHGVSMSLVPCSDIGSVRLSSKYVDLQCSGSESVRTMTFTGLLLGEDSESGEGKQKQQQHQNIAIA